MAGNELLVFASRPLRPIQEERYANLLRDILSQPTAPFVEDEVLAFVRAFAARRRAHCFADRFGNVLVSRQAALPDRPIVFVAHADHPGFIARQRRGDATLLADWHGSVEPSYFVGARVRFRGPDGAPARGVIRRIAALDKSGPSPRVRRVLVEVTQEVRPGAPGSWDLPTFRRRGRLVQALGCDDVAGLAAILAAYDLLARHEEGRRVALLATRAEEAGLIGASAAAFGHVLPDDALVVSVECSKAMPEAPQGAGAVVRVGDRISVFDPGLTEWLTQTAITIAGRDETFRWQRRLMPGGTCEASVFQSAGYRACALCIPLGNYHNRAERRGRIAAETIHLDDWFSLVRLLATAGALPPTRNAVYGPARRFRSLARHYGPLLRDPLARARPRG